MTFVRPLFLLLVPVVLLLLAVSLFLLVRRRERRARLFHTVLRAVLLILLVLALAEPRTTRSVEGRAVSFLVDVSRSIPEDVLPGVEQWIARAREARGPDDDDQVVLFGGRAAVEVPFGTDPGASAPDLLRPRARVDREATDLAGAIELALSSFPEGRARRIVLVTDGSENRGDAIAAARRAAGDGVELAVLPVTYQRTREVSVLRIADVTPRAAPGSVVTFTPILESTEDDVAVTVHAIVDGDERRTEKITAPRGKSRGPSFRMLFNEPGVHELSVAIEAEGDSVRRNNEGRASVQIVGEAGVLVVEGGSGPSEIQSALTSMGMATIRIAPAAMYENALLYQPFDAVVLSDVSALDLTTAQLESLEMAVRDLGVGLVVLGGENAYAPGGYRNTPLERCLPVRMEVKQKQVMLNGALALILHTCEFPNGNYWAVRIAQDSIASLTPRDYAGVIIYGASGDEWLLPLQRVQDPAGMASMLSNAFPGDMPAFDSSFRLAFASLQKCPAHLKHIVVISDGDAGQLNPALVRQIADARITVSTVCVVPHGKDGAQTMAAIARWGKGRFYLVDRNQLGTLPRIFVKEATTLRRNAVRRKPFVPKMTVSGQDVPLALKGFEGGFPALDALSIVEAKERAEVPLVGPDADPLLAIWRYGLGQSIAFTSAMKGGWIGDWAAWEDLERFWAQVVRSVFRQAGRSGFRATTDVRGGEATVRVTALSEGGEELDFLDMRAFVARPGEEPRPFRIVPRGNGVYEGTFDADAEGTYVAVIRYGEPGKERQIVAPVSVAYPEEYASLGTDEAFLSRLADEAGARILTGEEDVFRGDVTAAETSRPLASILLLLAAILLPVDIFFRRVRVDFGPLLRRVLPERREKQKAAAAPASEEAPDFTFAEAPSPVSAEPEKQPEKKAPPPKEAEPPSEHLEGLLEAKKRAKRKGRWEDTGQ